MATDDQWIGAVLMCPTPAKGYYLNGKRVPSVSTILGNLGWGSDQLMTWAVGITRAGGDHNAVRDEAALIGTCAHALIDAELNRRPFDDFEFTLDILLKAKPAHKAFQRWAARYNVELVDTEFQLVSSALRYGGTPDALVRIDGEYVLLDFKTSNWLYPKNIIQVVAYMDLIAECRGIQCERAIVLQVKKDGTISALPIEGETITQGRAAFYHLLELHKLKTPLEALTKSINTPGAVPESPQMTIMGKVLA